MPSLRGRKLIEKTLSQKKLEIVEYWSKSTFFAQKVDTLRVRGVPTKNEALLKIL